MASPFILLGLFLSLQCGIISSTPLNQIPQPYIVYMGSSSDNHRGENAEAADSAAHLQLLSSIIPSQESARVEMKHHYSHAFKGFSAMLTKNEASILSGHEKIISVFPDPMLKLHTTRSWDFLAQESGFRSSGFPHAGTTDVIIGVIDTGIWPESPSFNDKGIGTIPSRWKGVCMEGPDFHKYHCNRKLIGARYYNVEATTIQPNSTMLKKISKSREGSPRDYQGHGTHTASIAAGARVANASYFGLARGTAKGGLPSSRLAIYKACSLEGCSGSTILKAIDDAIKDGVDIISISLGTSVNFQSDYLSEPISIGAFHALERGVMVVASGGNEGPDPYTLVNFAPWILTVAASSIDRDFESTVLLGNGISFRGTAINFSNLTTSKTYPLAYGADVASKFTPPSEASNCYPGSLDPKKAAGKIIVCVNSMPIVSKQIRKLVVEDARAKGLIFIGEFEKSVPFDSGAFPFTTVGNDAGVHILKYINKSRKPTATIMATVEVKNFRPAPSVAYFSSRGPGVLTENILKPDIMAPGVAILAAMVPKTGIESLPNVMKPTKFATKSGTSMACPHVSGAAAFIKSVHPTWSASMIKSSLMTTAFTSNNIEKPLTNSTNGFANPHDMGVGELSPLKALNPGLVYETTAKDYLYFLCYYGYPENKVRAMSKLNFSCPKSSSEDLISNINYPSISIGRLSRNQGGRTIKRTLTNVALQNSTYIALIQSPKGLLVKVSPRKITYREGIRKASFKATFYGGKAQKGYNFGSITWYDGLHHVRTVFAVNVQ